MIKKSDITVIPPLPDSHYENDIAPDPERMRLRLGPAGVAAEAARNDRIAAVIAQAKRKADDAP